MKEVLDSLSVGVVVLAEDGSVEYVNRFCYEKGIVPQECAGKKYYEVFKSLELIGFVSELLEGKSGTLEFEYSGTVYRVSCPWDRCLQIEDITELSRFEKLQKEFAATVSHELSTPITAVKGLLETVLLQEVPSRELLERALKRVEDVEKLISSLRILIFLDFENKPARDRFSLKELVERVLEDLSEEISRKGLETVFAGEDAEIESDREKLYILIRNLVDNAVRYNREGGSVSIKIERGSFGTKLVVEDTGEGIAGEDMPFIFEPFFGGRNKKGMGLGLAISRKIADFLGAEIRIKSEEGKGTTAEVLIPQV